MSRPDPLICGRYGAEDIEAQNNRVRYLDDLYERDGRGEKTHPRHGLYTCLHLDYVNLPEAG